LLKEKLIEYLGWKNIHAIINAHEVILMGWRTDKLTEKWKHTWQNFLLIHEGSNKMGQNVWFTPYIICHTTRIPSNVCGNNFLQSLSCNRVTSYNQTKLGTFSTYIWKSFDKEKWINSVTSVWTSITWVFNQYLTQYKTCVQPGQAQFPTLFTNNRIMNIF
jgi:hypothetical protein